MAEELKPFAGTGVYLFCADDAEARQLEFEISSTLEMAGWHIVERRTAPMLSHNITIHTPFLGAPDELRTKAGLALAEYLQANKMEVLVIPFTPPPGTIRLE